MHVTVDRWEIAGGWRPRKVRTLGVCPDIRIAIGLGSRSPNSQGGTGRSQRHLVVFLVPAALRVGGPAFLVAFLAPLALRFTEVALLLAAFFAPLALRFTEDARLLAAFFAPAVLRFPAVVDFLVVLFALELALRVLGAAFFLPTFFALTAFRFAAVVLFFAVFFVLTAFRFAEATLFFVAFLALATFLATALRVGFSRCSTRSAVREPPMVAAASPSPCFTLLPAVAVAT